jgi:hypothetical protein
VTAGSSTPQWRHLRLITVKFLLSRERDVDTFCENLSGNAGD